MNLGSQPDADAPEDRAWAEDADEGIPADRQHHQPAIANQERHRSRYRRHWRFEVNEEGEEWVISYMDMVTLIMCAFVVIAALLDLQSSHTPQPLATGPRGTPDAAVPVEVPQILPLLEATGKGEGIVSEAAPQAEESVPVTSQAADPVAASSNPPPAANAHLPETVSPDDSAEDAKVQEQWRSAVAARGLEGRVTISARGRTVTMQIQDEILFPTGEAELQPLGRDVIRRIAPLLTSAGGDVRVEGHTDNVPIANDRFASNWELSAGRATSVVRALIDEGIAPARLRATGYADTRPEQANDGETGRAHNRRVALVIEQ
jgi:chemotaxis protein MotB